MKLSKILLLLIVVAALALFYMSGGEKYLTLSYLQGQLAHYRSIFETSPLQMLSLYFGIYVLATAFSLPGAAVLTLLAGAIFGPWYGVVIVSFASSLGALLSFLASRFLFRSFFEKKFQRQFKQINERVEKEGSLYLASLRLIPAFPFFIINNVMGLTKIKAHAFYWVSQLAMLPGTFAYVYAGKEFSKITSLKGILSLHVLVAFTLLGIIPLLGKIIFNRFKSRRTYKNYHRPKKFDYNLIAIGGGSAGLVTTYIGSAVKAKVALIEKHKMGGDCLNTGCVPSKALIKSAKVIHLIRTANKYGFKNASVDFDFSEIMDRVQNIINEVEPHDSIDRYQGLGVDCLTGEARILDPWTVEVSGKKYTTQKLVISTGAVPSVPQIPGIEKAKYVTSENLWKIRELPKKLVIMGGGPIGIEMAQAFSRFGSEVTIVEFSERILAKEDREVASLLTQILEREGVKILTSHKVVSFDSDQLRCQGPSGEMSLDYDLVLIATGRKANIHGFGLQELGIIFRSNGTIETNDYLQTKYPNIYACGDVAGPFQLTHMAAHQAWYCAVNALFPKKFKVDYSVVPWCTYCDPEVATVGETESSAREKGLIFEVTQYELSDLDRAITETATEGFVRVITEKGKDKILGTTIVGAQASSMIVEYVSAMKNKKGLNSILGTIHVYPSFGEANKYAAGVWKKNHVNPKVMKILHKYFHWQRN